MSWVGGDIVGLIAMGSTLSTTAPELKSIADALSSSVNKLASDASWSGHAASNFHAAWTLSSTRIDLIKSGYEEFGKTISNLGNQLQDLENQLYSAATQAKSEGAQIGENGEPLPLVISGDPNAPEAVKAVNAQNDYNEVYAHVMQDAQGYRIAAAEAVQGIAATFAPYDEDKKVPWDKATTLADYAKGLYTIPNAKNDHLAQVAPGKISALRDELNGARKDLKAAKNAYAAKGMKLPNSNWARTNHLGVVNDLKSTEAALGKALLGDGELPFSKAMSYSLSDVAKLAHPGAAMAGLPKGLKFLQDVPVVDVLAAGLIGHLQTVDDVEKGWSPDTAKKADYGAQLTGVAAGAGVVAVAALAPFEVPAALVVGGAGLVAWGVGDFGYAAVHEHWSEDIHDRGVASGLWHGTGHVFSETGKAIASDVTDVGSAIGDGAKSLWHKAFG